MQPQPAARKVVPDRYLLTHTPFGILPEIPKAGRCTPQPYWGDHDGGAAEPRLPPVTRLVAGGPSEHRHRVSEAANGACLSRCHDTREEARWPSLLVVKLASTGVSDFPKTYPAGQPTSELAGSMQLVPLSGRAPPAWTRRPLSRRRSGYLRPGCRIAARHADGLCTLGWDPQHHPPLPFYCRTVRGSSNPPCQVLGWVWAVVVATMGLIDKGPEGTATPTPPCGFDARERTATQDI
jgi:hypothetical protein